MINCIFCKIIEGIIPCYKVYEDKNFLAFLDINPLNPGHTLVVPKKHYRWMLEVPSLGVYWERVGKIARAIQKKLKAERINFAVLGEEVPHAHVHIIPRFPGDDLGGAIDWSKRKNLSDNKLLEIAKIISKEI